jgi:hypothetical protein
MAAPVDLGAAEALMRARLVAIVRDTVDVSDKVHDYWRNIRDEGTRNALMKDGGTGALHCWFVSLAFDGTLTQERGLGLARATLVYDIHGYMAVNDEGESEKVFARKVLDVVTKLNGSQQLVLNGVPLSGAGITDSGPVQVPEFNAGDITGVLVHHARITVPVQFQAGDC